MHPCVPVGDRWSRECGAVAEATEGPGEEFTAACSRPRGHAGEHRDDWRDVSWSTAERWRCARCGLLTGVHALGAACPYVRVPFRAAGAVRPGARRAG